MEPVNKIRIRVFGKEQNISKDLEFDGLDSEVEHVEIYMNICS